jgi:hypothetical protein
VQAARERLDQGGDRARQLVGNGVEVDPRDPLRHDEQLGVGAVQERQ